MPGKRTRKDESEGESSAEETPVLVKKPASGTVTVPVPDKQINAEGDTYFEMYTDKASGELKPGKKGISLSEEQFMGLVNVHEGISQALNELDVGGSSKITKPTKVAKTTRTKASSSKEPKDAKPASKPKPTSKKKARKVESDEEDEDED
ncbi:unnamed protein product [Rhizoctonia solani]|uniref:Transcriptional coactivator p15 (PC4) C-terminal domain-containing protein n=1 Tax=Rhizoctonia solani TaxID=456999 RepID=A0A8H3GFU3_9AGAM|nr:unnamed protein product [Rhizoctonia solani]